MTATREKAAESGAKEGSGLGKYVAVGLLATALGIGAVLVASQIGGSASSLSPAQLAEIRAEQYVDYLETQWLAQNSTANDTVNRPASVSSGELAQIQEQRAEEMVERFANEHRHRLQLAEIHEQRAQDMVTFKLGGTASTDQ